LELYHESRVTIFIAQWR